jgi:hypothetical protein
MVALFPANDENPAKIPTQRVLSIRSGARGAQKPGDHKDRPYGGQCRRMPLFGTSGECCWRRLILRTFLGVVRFAKMPARRLRIVSPRGEADQD